MMERVRLSHLLHKHTLARVSKNAAALFVAQTGTRVLNLVLIARLTRTLGVEALGRYLLAMTVQAITLAVADLGLNTLATREFSRTPARDEAALWGTILGLKLAAAWCGIVVLNALVGPFFGGERRVIISLVSLSLVPDAFNATAVALIKGRQRMEISSAINLGTRILYVLVGAILVWREYGIRELVVSYAAVSLLGSLAYGTVLVAWRTYPRWTAIPHMWRSLLRESVPFAVTGMVAMLYTRLDLLIISYWHGDAAAGLYGAAYRLWEALGMVPSSFLDALFPELSRSRGRVREAGFRDLYRRGRQILLLIAPLLVVLGEIVAPAMVTFLYGRTSQVPILVFRVLLLAFPFTCLYLLNGHALYAAGQQRRVMMAMVAVTTINALGNFALVSRWSYWGAVGVMLASELLLYAVLQVAVRQSILRPLEPRDEEGE